MNNLCDKKSYMSLRKISAGYKIEPAWAIHKWLSEPSSLEFILLWESMHNLDFNKETYLEICSNALSHGCAPQISELQKKCSIKCMFVDKEYYGCVFAHKDIASDFASMLSPAFRTYCLLALQDRNHESYLSFKSEEDYIVSPKTLADFTQKKALDSFCRQFSV